MWGKIALVVFSLLLAIGAAEAYVRIAELAPVVHRIQPGLTRSAYQMSDNPILGYEYKKSYVDDRPVDKRLNFSRTNAHGFRDVERAIAKEPGTTRILMIGDSVTAGQGIQEIEDTIPQQLEKILNERAEGDFEVFNMGITGYCTRAAVETLLTKGLAFQPDIVVLLFVDNDFENYNGGITAFKFNRPPLTEQLFLHSSLFRLLSLRLNLFHFRSELDPTYQYEWNNKAIGDNNVEDGLALLRDLADRHDFKVLLAAWPRLGETVFYIPEMFEPTDPGTLKIETLGRKYGIPVFRLKPFFDASFAQYRLAGNTEYPTPERLYSYDVMHPNERGAKRAAEALFEVLRENSFGVSPK